MLWYKMWLETRWRFVIGLVLTICSACSVVLVYPEVLKLLPAVPKLDLGGEIGRKIQESAELVRDYRGYVWSQAFEQSVIKLWTIFAILLGTGGAFSQSAGLLFTLSMPASRNRVLMARAVTGLSELFLLALAPALVFPILSPFIGQSYGIGDALIHSLCMFLAGAVFFSLAFLLSSMLADLWQPLLLALMIAVILALLPGLSHDLARFSIFRVMNAEVYFRTGELPWLGLFASIALSLAMLYGAVVRTARRDF